MDIIERITNATGAANVEATPADTPDTWHVSLTTALTNECLRGNLTAAGFTAGKVSAWQGGRRTVDVTAQAEVAVEAINHEATYTAKGAVPRGWVEILGVNVSFREATALCEQHVNNIADELQEVCKKTNRREWFDSRGTRWAWISDYAAQPATAQDTAFAVGDTVEAAVDITDGMALGHGAGGEVWVAKGTRGNVTAIFENMPTLTHRVLFNGNSVSTLRVNPAWLRRIEPGDALPDSMGSIGGDVLPDDEPMTWDDVSDIDIDTLPLLGVLPGAYGDMPTVWASEHAAVVAERDALVRGLDKARKTLAARRAGAQAYVKVETEIRKAMGKGPNKHIYRVEGEAKALGEALDTLAKVGA